LTVLVHGLTGDDYADHRACGAAGVAVLDLSVQAARRRRSVAGRRSDVG
jgi:hypothetical protein